jgi:hypothetical protein
MKIKTLEIVKIPNPIKLIITKNNGLEFSIMVAEKYRKEENILRKNTY